MSKTRKDSTKRGAGRDRHISVRAVRRDPPDLRKLGRAVVQLALAQAAVEAAAQQDSDTTTTAPYDSKRDTKTEGGLDV